jgi:L-serine/L-threonine ammonia-lyase
MSTLHINSPCVESTELTDVLGAEVWVKLDCAQPSGSFKIRGFGLQMTKLKEQGIRKFVIASGGNAGLAAAYAGLDGVSKYNFKLCL